MIASAKISSFSDMAGPPYVVLNKIIGLPRSMTKSRNFTHTPNNMNQRFMLLLWDLRASIDITTNKTAIPLVLVTTSSIARSTATLRLCWTWTSNSQSAQPIVGMYSMMGLPITSSKTRMLQSCKMTFCCHKYFVV